MDCSNYTEAQNASPLELIIKAAYLIPTSQYLLWGLLVCSIALYNFLEFHFFGDLLTGFRGNLVSLTYNSCSEIYNGVVSKCPSLHGRYLVTPWLSSPHIQTAFLNFFGNPPAFTYRRQIFQLPDGGTIALDWLMHSNVLRGTSRMNYTISKDDTTPIVVVVPGLTSDSCSAYIKHLVYEIAKRGWNVVVSNHRGLGGISITSDCFYNAGWTDDVRKVVDHVHEEFPKSLLFAVGTSIGANVLVKYLGEEGDNTPFAGAAAVCSPWDLLVCDRFICRKLVQRLYDRALTIGLQGYAQLHESIFSRLADWEGITKSRSVRDFDNYATCIVGKYETVDTYYRHCSSTSFVRDVSVPLLCISFLDDPVCTREAIPWDECRANKNIVLATTPHGGHLGFFEGITANRLWWARAVDEFLFALHSSPFMHKQNNKAQHKSVHFALESAIDQGPYVSITENGMVSAVGDEKPTKEMIETLPENENIKEKDTDIEQREQENTEAQIDSKNINTDEDVASVPVKRCIDQLSKQNKRSMWLLAYIALLTTWPFLGSTLFVVFKRKFKNVLPAWLRN
ncbi:hypothetical protein GIB67_026288 [Kingdonia uniflora]|uniref:Serine aminopeptidase S33 domain-containing protein n=1 Tax=Kingdonia uniflora TaxID=39325 RepID=A0A7J7L9W5_9MAGN|nr:hypothetical protein GIB67_026288 [Kingdonia uniflora]